MSWLLALLCLGVFLVLGMQWRAGFKHRGRFKQEGRETYPFWWFARAAIDEAQQTGNASKAATQVRPASHPAPTPLMPGIRRVAFDYLDQDGNFARSEVTAERYHYGKLYAHCHLRRAQRTFFLDSIIGDVIDTRTGESMDKQVWAETL